MKKRAFRKRNVGVQVPHPDGGVLHLMPLDLQRASALNAELETLDYELDAQGNVKLEGGKPVERQWRNAGEIIAAKVKVVRRYCVAGASGFIDVDSCNELEMTEEMIEAVLAEISIREIEREVPLQRWDEEKQKHVLDRDESGKIKTEKRMVPANEPGFVWAMEEAAKLGESGRAELGNS